jgi:hypothetical protein
VPPRSWEMCGSATRTPGFCRTGGCNESNRGA